MMEKKKTKKIKPSLARKRRAASKARSKAGRAHAMMPEKQRIAVFDFDGTLVSAQSGTEFAKFLFFHHYIGPWTVSRIIWWGLRYTLHLPHDQNAVRKIFIKGLSKRYSKRQVKDMMREFHDERLVKRYRSAGFRQVQQMKDAGCICLLASATFDGVAEVATSYAGLDGFVATTLAEDANGYYTGDVVGEVAEGPAKLQAIQGWCDARFGPGNWIIEYAFGDHHSDREVLEMAVHPVAVNPGSVLKSSAKKRGWPIVEWR